MNAGQIASMLREHGIAVQHTSPLPRSLSGEMAFAVFLDPTRNQRDQARVCVLRLDAVTSVKFSGFTPWVMFVTFTPVGLSSRAWA